MAKHVTVHSNDKVTPLVALTVLLDVVPKTPAP